MKDEAAMGAELSAEDLFLAWIEGHGLEDVEAFRGLCAARPDRALELERLRENWIRLAEVLPRLPERGSLAASVPKPERPGGDPEVVVGERCASSFQRTACSPSSPTAAPRRADTSRGAPSTRVAWVRSCGCGTPTCDASSR